MKPARDPASNRPKLSVALKKHRWNIFCSLLFIIHLKKETGRAQKPAFPSEPFRFAPLTLIAHSPWLFENRASLCPSRIFRLLTRWSVPRCVYACCCSLPGRFVQCPQPLACYHLIKGAKLELGRGAHCEHHPQPTNLPTCLNRPTELRRQRVDCIS